MSQGHLRIDQYIPPGSESTDAFDIPQTTILEESSERRRLQIRVYLYFKERNAKIPLLSCFISGSRWLFCFIAAIDVQILGLSRQLAENNGDGDLPTLSSLQASKRSYLTFHKM
ncbi:hypothetical protein MMC22_004155 [Lobaria immixta]|nr:hypothetical protein [Lobaria immixta]